MGPFCFYIYYDICFYNFCEKHPLMDKKRFESLKKKVFSKYLTSIFGCCRRPNIRLMTQLSLPPSSSSTSSSTSPFFIYLGDLHAKKWRTRLKFPSGIFGCKQNKRQRYEILNDICSSHSSCCIVHCGGLSGWVCSSGIIFLCLHPEEGRKDTRRKAR